MLISFPLIESVASLLLFVAALLIGGILGYWLSKCGVLSVFTEQPLRKIGQRIIRREKSKILGK